MPLEARRYVHLRHLLARCSAELVAGVLRAQPKTKKARISASLQIVVRHQEHNVAIEIH